MELVFVVKTLAIVSILKAPISWG